MNPGKEGIQASFYIKEDAIRTSRKNRPRNAPMRKKLVPILGEGQRGILETWWKNHVSRKLLEDFQNWRDTDAPPSIDSEGARISRNDSENALERAFASSAGLPFTVENIADRALRDILRLEYQGISQTLTRRYLLEEFVEKLASIRGVGEQRKATLKKIVSPMLPGFD